MSKNELNNFNDAPPSYTLHQHACLTLNSNDCFRLIRFPSIIIDVVRQAIITSWPRGIQNEENYHSAYEFKLNGNPWWCQGFEGISARILMVHVLSTLYNHGWYLLASTDLSKKQLDKDALFFQHGILPSQTSFFAIAFDEYDKLRLIGIPSEIIPAIQQCLNPDDIQREEWLYGGVAYQFKLRGNPWMAGKEEGIYSRMKLLSILDCLTTFGWKLYASIDMNKGQEGRDTDTWFFRRDIQ